MSPGLRTVPDLLAEAASRAPRSVALLGDAVVDYGTLATSASAFARGLRAAGSAVGDRVALWTRKSTAYATAILGTMAAGAVYVPIDGGQPVERVRAILHDAEPIALVTDRGRLEELLGAGLPATVREVLLVDGATTVSLDGVTSRPLAAWTESTLSPATLPAIGLDDLAAILYTSGSTGTPKGVTISHRNLAVFIAWATSELRLGPDDVFANHASFNFDLSTFDLFAAIASSARVWIIPDEETRNVPALVDGIRRYGVTVWYSVPSILSLLVSSGALTQEIAASFRYVIFAGEVFPTPRLRQLQALLPRGAALYNWYGPTETNVCTWYRVGALDPDRTAPVPIGRAVASAILRVVDDDGKELSERAAMGELVVEGDCVTPGYWRREDPRKAVNHRRGRHATGDLVSWQKGELVFHGRKDRMVKLGGYRVELGEIESALQRHPTVREAAAVAVVEREPKRIIVFYSGTEEGRATLMEMKLHCGRFLPRYMVPHLFVRLRELPKTPNGKVDYVTLAKLAVHGDPPAESPRTTA